MPRQINCLNNFSTSKRLHIKDRKTGLSFLVDTGSDVSLIPVNSQLKLKADHYVIYAANNSQINTYGFNRLKLDLGFSRNLHWNFLIASVPYPIIGADFLSYFGLSVDLKNRKLLDSNSGDYAICFFKEANVTDISSINKSLPFYDIISKYPDIINLSKLGTKVKHGIFHHIVTTGPPVSQRPR